jgi:hypothetical protein
MREEEIGTTKGWEKIKLIALKTLLAVENI